MVAKDAKNANRLEYIDIDPETGKEREEPTEGDLDKDQDDLLQGIVNEFDASDREQTFRADISRIPSGYKRGMKEPWLFDCDAAEIMTVKTKLRDEYGGGLFRIRIKRNGKPFRQFDYSVEAPATKITGGDNRYDALASAFERTQQQLLAISERLAVGTPALPPPAIDPFVMMERMSTIMRNMQPAPAPSGGGELDVFLKAAEFVQNIVPTSGGGDDNWISVLKELIKSPAAGEFLQGALAQRNQQRPGHPAQRRMLPQAPQQPINTNPRPENNSAHAAGNQLEQAVKYLIGRAALDKDPVLYGSWLLDNVPPNLIGPMLNDPNMLDQLTTLFPRIAQFRPWFEELKQAAIEEFAEMRAQNGDGNLGVGPGRQGGDHRDPQPHGQDYAPGSPHNADTDAGGGDGAGLGGEGL